MTTRVGLPDSPLSRGTCCARWRVTGERAPAAVRGLVWSCPAGHPQPGRSPAWFGGHQCCSFRGVVRKDCNLSARHSGLFRLVRADVRGGKTAVFTNFKRFETNYCGDWCRSALSSKSATFQVDFSEHKTTTNWWTSSTTVSDSPLCLFCVTDGQ